MAEQAANPFEQLRPHRDKNRKRIEQLKASLPGLRDELRRLEKEDRSISALLGEEKPRKPRTKKDKGTPESSGDAAAAAGDPVDADVLVGA